MLTSVDFRHGGGGGGGGCGAGLRASWAAGVWAWRCGARWNAGLEMRGAEERWPGDAGRGRGGPRAPGVSLAVRDAGPERWDSAVRA